MKVRATHDVAGDTAYVSFGDVRDIARTVAPLEDIAIDLDAEGHVVGIEFVTASAVLDPSTFDKDPRLEELIGITEIAELIGKHKQNVAQHYTRRRDFPDPAAELPTGRYWRRGDVERWHQQVGVESQRVPGRLRGKIQIKPGFDDLPPGFDKAVGG